MGKLSGFDELMKGLKGIGSSPVPDSETPYTYEGAPRGSTPGYDIKKEVHLRGPEVQLANPHGPEPKIGDTTTVVLKQTSDMGVAYIAQTVVITGIFFDGYAYYPLSDKRNV